MEQQDRSIISWFAFAAAIAALVVAFVGVADGGSESASGGGGTRPTIEVVMTDFAFSPATITIPTSGATLTLVNDGASVHNFEILGQGIKSPDVASGVTDTFEVPALAAGTYQIICPQPGHEGAGMVGTLIVGESAASTDGGSGDGMASSSDQMTWSQMDALMLKVAQQYPAVTEGKGGDLMPFEEKTDADGIVWKEFGSSTGRSSRARR